MKFSTLLLLSLALGLGSCRSQQNKIALEARFMALETEEKIYAQADQPLGGSLALISMPVAGANSLWGLELGVGHAEDDLELGNGEYNLQERSAWLGVRYSFLDGHYRPYVGTGVQFSQHEVTLKFGGAETVRTTDGYGVYGEAGMQMRLTQAWHVLLGYRQTFGIEGSFGGLDLNLDTRRGFAGFGWSF